MAYTSLEQVLNVVDRLNLTRMAAFDGDGHTIDTAEASNDGELMELIQSLVANNSGTIRLECWQAPHPRKPGETKAEAKKVERCSWRIRGTLGASVVADPVATPTPAPVAAPQASAAVAAMSIEMHVAHAKLGWEVEALKRELADAYNDDDGDDDREPAQPAPALPATLFGMTGDQTFEVFKGLAKLVEPMIAPGRSQAIAGTPATAVLSAQELELFEAFRRFGAADPDNAKSVIENLMSTYGPNAKPAPDGK